MKIQEFLQGKGTVTRKFINKVTGETVNEIMEPNLIVKIGRVELIKLLGGLSSQKVSKMGVGSGGADVNGAPFVPTPPQDGDTGLASAKRIQDIQTTTTDFTKTNPKITFVTTFDCDQVNSYVNELGLFFTDGTTIFSRYTFKTVPLFTGDNIMMETSWQIEF